MTQLNVSLTLLLLTVIERGLLPSAQLLPIYRGIQGGYIFGFK